MVIATTSLRPPPARFTTPSMLRKITRAWPSKSPAIDLPASSTRPVCPDTHTILPPSVTTPGVNPRDCARSCFRYSRASIGAAPSSVNSTKSQIDFIASLLTPVSFYLGVSATPPSSVMNSRRLVCRERSRVRGDRGGVVMAQPPSRPEARSRLGSQTANELGAPVASSIPEQLPGREPASARKGYEDGNALLLRYRCVEGSVGCCGAARAAMLVGT